MNAKVDTEESKMDGPKLTVAALIAGAGLAGFYFFPDQHLLVRVIGLLVVLGVAAGLALTTDRGRALWQFMQDTRMEVRKVVWPGRSETTQTTLLVVGMVFIVALLLWLYDSLLGWLIRWLTGQGA
jgi:preprotein translocase subunit SecE